MQLFVSTTGPAPQFDTLAEARERYTAAMWDAVLQTVSREISHAAFAEHLIPIGFSWAEIEAAYNSIHGHRSWRVTHLQAVAIYTEWLTNCERLPAMPPSIIVQVYNALADNSLTYIAAHWGDTYENVIEDYDDAGNWVSPMAGESR